ncbi:LysR family transcriptional regulator [uncultured Desulfovibrio sp.]|uniref:LysR family transcriptional regulator n=1 Tax=uncultured Desulfovibrio sp. TaxID=167968 RepID=UPI00261B1464|nr:LysR family transcriptional regulator [uncultured Desulfovibrio sp.]
MTLTQLEIFSTVAARRGFTAAALQLGISQSGVSHAIEALEQEFGVALLRRGKNLELTDVGARLLRQAQAMLGLAESMRQEASDARGMKRGTLRIGSFGPTASLRLLPPVLEKYRAVYPGIEIHVDEGPDGEVAQWLTDHRVDIGFVTLPDDRFDTFPLMEDQLVALLPLEHPLAKKNAVTLEELCASPFAMTRAGSEDIIGGLFRALRLQPTIRWRSLQLVSTIAAVARGEAVSIVAESALPPDKTQDYVKKPLRPAARRQVALAVPDARRMSPAAREFIRMAQEVFPQPVQSAARPTKR